MKQTIKIILSLIVLAIAWYIIWWLLTNKPTTKQLDLQKLDEISTRLAEITKRQTVLSWEIYEREMEYFDLNSEAIRLNEEATSIFIKMMDQKGLIDQEEPKTQCDALIEQELENIKLWIQTKEWFIGLVAWAWCEYDWPFPETEWYPGKLTEDWTHQEMPELTWTTSHERFKEIAQAYWLDASMIWKVEERYRLTEWLVLCITIAETSWGNRWYAQSNPGNVWNNDRWDRVTYALLESWIEAIGKTLNNQYLWGHTTLWCLSNAGSCSEPNDNQKRYATSTKSREANMVACLSDIYEPINPSTFNIRNR